MNRGRSQADANPILYRQDKRLLSLLTPATPLEVHLQLPLHSHDDRHLDTAQHNTLRSWLRRWRRSTSLTHNLFHRPKKVTIDLWASNSITLDHYSRILCPNGKDWNEPEQMPPRVRFFMEFCCLIRRNHDTSKLIAGREQCNRRTQRMRQILVILGSHFTVR